MIVSCESCKSRYKIDDSKISGRGARITCPRCKHQFVVYTADKNAGPSMVSQQNPDWDDEPTRVGAKKGDKSGDKSSAGSSNQTITPPPPATPRLDKRPATESVGERPTERTPTAAGATDAAASLSQLRAPPPEEEPSGAGYEVSQRVQKLSPAEAAARAPTLDFRKVGISAWKVKVKIGLIYDFSDLKTLRKYIQDARVTPADLISHDGKSWRAIGDIPDLDVYFVETYDQLFADQANRPTEEPKPKVTPPPIDTSSLNGGSFEEEMDSKRTRARPMTAPTRASGQAQKPAEGGSNTGMMVGVGLVLALLLAGGMWYVTQGPGAPAPTPTPAPTPASTVDKDQIRKGIIEGMTPVETPEPAPSIDPKLLEPTLVPVGPRGTLTPVPPPGGVPANNGSTVSQKESTAAEYLEAGVSAERAGRWAEAVAAYTQASKKDPRNSSIKVRLGVAQYNSKDLNGAQTSLESAIQLGAKGEALRVLGDIYAANGDVAGARDYYQRYLAGNPRDKAAVEQKLQKLNGG